MPSSAPNSVTPVQFNKKLTETNDPIPPKMAGFEAAQIFLKPVRH